MSDTNAPVEVASFRHELEAGILVNALQRHAIDARAVGESVSGLRAEAPGDVVVFVPAHQADEARRIMRQLKQSTGDIDWSQVDVGDPLD